MASVAAIIREVSPEPFAPLAVRFRHPPPPATAAHERAFDCPVAFEADMDALLVPAAALSRPNRLGDEGITRYLLKQLDAELGQRTAGQSFADTVKDAVGQSLSEGAPRMVEVARRLGMSERTLHRRLGEEGVSFQRLVEDARRALAEGLLVQTDYSLAEIAFLTGFSEQSAFTRAFRRWLDQTPAAYREARQGA